LLKREAFSNSEAWLLCSGTWRIMFRILVISSRWREQGPRRLKWTYYLGCGSPRTLFMSILFRCISQFTSSINTTYLQFGHSRAGHLVVYPDFNGQIPYLFTGRGRSPQGQSR
jgi:hypothetical protein